MSDSEITDMMRAIFADLGLEEVSNAELHDLIGIHGRALGACALEFQKNLEADGIDPGIPHVDAVLAQIRSSSFESPVSGAALIAELANTLAAENLRSLLLGSHLVVRAAGARSRSRDISLIDALDDIVVTVGRKAVHEWSEDRENPRGAWSSALFEAARSTAEVATGQAFFRDETST